MRRSLIPAPHWKAVCDVMLLSGDVIGVCAYARHPPSTPEDPAGEDSSLRRPARGSRA